jgi:hypothetical protein
MGLKEYILFRLISVLTGLILLLVVFIYSYIYTETETPLTQIEISYFSPEKQQYVSIRGGRTFDSLRFNRVFRKGTSHGNPLYYAVCYNQNIRLRH